MKPTSLSLPRCIALTGVLALASLNSAQAVTYYWNTADGTFNTGANWSNNATSGGTTGTVPGSADTGVFNQSSVNGNQIIQLDANHAVSVLSFNNTFTTNLASDTATPRTLTLGSSGNAMTISTTAGAVTLGDAINTLNVAIGASQSWINNSANTLNVINGVTSAGTSGIQTLNITGAAGTTFSGLLANGSTGGVIAITKTAGTLALSNASNSYTGATRINGGTLSINSIANGGAASQIGASSSFTFNFYLGKNGAVGSTLEYTGATATTNRGFTVQDGTFKVTNAATNLTFTGVYNDNDNGNQLALIKTGGGTLTLSGVTAGTLLAPAVIVNEGRLVSNGSGTADFGRLGAATVNSGGILELGGSFDQLFNGSGGTGNLTVNGTGIVIIGNSDQVISGAFTGDGTVRTNSTSGTRLFRTQASSTTATFSGTLQDGTTGAKLAFEVRGNGLVQQLTGAGNTYTGGTIISRGTLAIGNNTALGTGSLRFSNNTATTTTRLQSVDGTARTLSNVLGTFGGTTATYAFGNTIGGTGNLTFSDTTTSSLGTATRTFQIDNAFTEFAMGFSGTGGGITKTGEGTMVMNGTSTYTGDTTVNGGILAVSGNSIPDAGKVTINSGNITLTGTEVVSTLYFGATQKAAGLWGAPGNLAATFTDARFTGTGLLSVSSGSAGGNYTTWASNNGIPGQPSADNFDNDTMSNGMEYALGLSPTVPNGSPGTFNGLLLSFNKGAEAVANGDVLYRIEVSADLGVSVPWTEVGSYVLNNSSVISANIPNGPSRNFARLRVVVNP